MAKCEILALTVASSGIYHDPESTVYITCDSHFMNTFLKNEEEKTPDDSERSRVSERTTIVCMANAATFCYIWNR